MQVYTDLLRLEKGQTEVIRKKNVFLFLFVNFISNYCPFYRSLTMEEVMQIWKHGSNNCFREVKLTLFSRVFWFPLTLARKASMKDRDNM